MDARCWMEASGNGMETRRDRDARRPVQCSQIWFGKCSFQNVERERSNALLFPQKQGTANPCFVSNLVNELELKENANIDLDTIKGCAGLAYAGTWLYTTG